MLAWLLKKVTFTCNRCPGRQRIPVRRLHFFERFNQLDRGQAILIRCPQCGEGLQIPTPYRNHNGQPVQVDAAELPADAFIHEHFL